MVRCLIGLGSNLGHSQSILDQALEFLSKNAGLVAQSPWYCYPSVGPTEQGEQPDFLNGVALIDTDRSAAETAQMLHAMESQAGRQRLARWSSRTLDADLLLYGQKIIYSPDLIVPHPRMMSRRFVLEPAAKVAPDFVHPVIGWTIQKLFRHLVDAAPFFVVLGSDLSSASRLAHRLAEATGGSCYTNDELQTTGTTSRESIECTAHIAQRIAAAISGGQPGPWFADCWVGDSWVGDSWAGDSWVGDSWVGDSWVDDSPSPLSTEVGWKDTTAAKPKLILLLDAATSPRAKQIANVMRSQPECCVPVIHLSPNEADAWQDALGAVQGMQ